MAATMCFNCIHQRQKGHELYEYFHARGKNFHSIICPRMADRMGQAPTEAWVAIEMNYCSMFQLQFLPVSKYTLQQQCAACRATPHGTVCKPVVALQPQLRRAYAGSLV